MRAVPCVRLFLVHVLSCRQTQPRNSLMANGTVIAICITPTAGEPMHEVNEVQAIAGAGLAGDRYCTAEGSWNRGVPGKRQVTLINGVFFGGTGFSILDTRRNFVTAGIELMWLIGREFEVGNARFRGVKYCDPCARPSKLSGKPHFAEVFHDRGGLVAEVLEGGLIRTGDSIIPPPRNY